MFRPKEIDYLVRSSSSFQNFFFFKNKLSGRQFVCQKKFNFFSQTKYLFLTLVVKCLFRDFLQVVADSILTNYQHLSLSEKQQASKKNSGRPKMELQKNDFLIIVMSSVQFRSLK